jgi:hypothetical protein
MDATMNPSLLHSGPRALKLSGDGRCFFIRPVSPNALKSVFKYVLVHEPQHTVWLQSNDDPVYILLINTFLTYKALADFHLWLWCRILLLLLVFFFSTRIGLYHKVNRRKAGKCVTPKKKDDEFTYTNAAPVKTAKEAHKLNSAILGRFHKNGLVCKSDVEKLIEHFQRQVNGGQFSFIRTTNRVMKNTATDLFGLTYSFFLDKINFCSCGTTSLLTFLITRTILLKLNIFKRGSILIMVASAFIFFAKGQVRQVS